MAQGRAEGQHLGMASLPRRHGASQTGVGTQLSLTLSDAIPTLPIMDKDRERLEYERSTGKEATELPPDHPDRWQWEYDGSPAARASMKRKLRLVQEKKGIVQEKLFD